jgi:hypothetical protein
VQHRSTFKDRRIQIAVPLADTAEITAELGLVGVERGRMLGALSCLRPLYNIFEGSRSRHSTADE